MKTQLPRWFLAVTIFLGLGNTAVRAQDSGLVVHEWGTFTSFQGSDGVLLPWKPLETPKLPAFVYDWKHPGLGRVSTSPFAELIKPSVVTLQRLETPVVYFYSDTEQTVDVDVKFPKGWITEWFPQSSQIGPAEDVPESLIRWSNVQVKPAPFDSGPDLPVDSSGSHYFAARETDAAHLLPHFFSSNIKPEHEKFLFYRGVANFATPLRVTMNRSNSPVTITNSGKEPLSSLFVLSVEGDKSGNFVAVPSLTAGTESNIAAALTLQQNLPREELEKRLGKEMAAALVKEGLYPREAEAMVNTWKDSWFQEPGLRVLYVLPRGWTDATLPMKITPVPKEVVRVMVGRAEILSPKVEQEFARQLAQAGRGDAASLAAARETLKGFGRFAEPAFNRILPKSDLTAGERSKVAALLRPQPASGGGGGPHP